MSRALILLLVFTLMHLSAKAQVKFIDRFTLRQSFQSKNDKAEPATITYTKPKDSISSWSLNAALGYNILYKTQKVITLNPFIEFHKNTLVTKKQDNWQTGLSFEWQLIPFELGSKNWSPTIIAAEKYSKDKIKNNTALQGNLYLTVIRKKKGLDFKYFYLPNHPINLGKVLQFEYSPYVGFENENRIGSNKDSSEGNIYRYYSRITSLITLLPKNVKLRGRFEFYIDFQHRYDFEKSVKNIVGNKHNYFTTSVNYTFFKTDDDKKSAKIGFDYVNGEDPTKNFEKQSFYAVSLKVKL